MSHFFADSDQIKDNEIVLFGEDYNHIKNVLRMRPGDHIFVSCGQELVYECAIDSFKEQQVVTRILDVSGQTSELRQKVVLFQGLAKGEKMDWVIQKAVELGASEIVPVAMSRSVVKFDDKKAQKKTARWNTIAKHAAQQSGRGMIPKVSEVLNFEQACRLAGELGIFLVPYEKASHMKETRDVFADISQYTSIGVMIGPEGGFDDQEIDMAHGFGGKTISLGKRILRTETAGLAVLSVLMFLLEEIQ